MSNININNSNKIKLKISKSEYWDFKLSKDNNINVLFDGSLIYDDNLISFIDFNNINCIVNSGLTVYGVSNYKWQNAVNDGLLLKNIGFTGIDNGLILFNKENILQDEFINLLTGSTYTINSGDTRVVLNAVSGNSGDFTYNLEVVNNTGATSVSLNGGFYQGFFKSGDYCVLPTEIENEICYEFVLKPDLVSEPLPNTLNNKYPNNKGMFFFLGARSENKFWYDYYKKEDINSFIVSKTGQTSPIIENITLSTDDGFNVLSQNVYDIPTDNKFLLINRTINGHTASNFDDSNEYHITGESTENVNLYLYINRTKTGYTASNKTQISGSTKPYSIINDLTRNALGFIIKDDGSIGYRMINEDCGGETINYIIEEEYSNDNIIKNGEITYISVRMVLNGTETCTGKRMFKLMFYVNGKLVFTSKWLPELLLRELDDRGEKQEGIPYCISLGGGSQGLCDMIGLNSDNYKVQYLLPIEENFAGSFIGNLYKFKIFYGKTDFSKIKNNYLFQIK